MESSRSSPRRSRTQWQTNAPEDEITEHFDITAAAISRHLSVLKEADLIEDTRDGKFIYYELNATVLEEILLWVSDLKGEGNHDPQE